MPSVNKAIIMGHLGHSPKVTEVGDDKVANFSIATNSHYKDKDGNKQKKTEWHYIVLWGMLAEIAEKYLKKGSPVYVEGRLQSREYEDKEGNKKRVTEVVGNSLQLLGSKSDGDSGGDEPVDPDALPF